MTKFFQHCTILFLCIIMLGCYKQPRELTTAETLMETAPDSALHILQRVDSKKLSGSHNRALYALLMSQALDKNDINVESDSLTTIATDYFKSSDAVRVGYAWFYHARTARNRGNVEEQADNLLKASGYAQKASNNVLSGLVYYDMANMYFNQRKYNNSISYFKTAIDYYKHTNEKRSLILSNLYIGYCYLYLSKVDSAKLYYKVPESIAKNINSKDLLSITLRNIGTLYFQQGNFHEALRYFYNVPLTGNKIYDGNKFSLIAGVYIQTNVLDSAKYYLRKIDDFHGIAPDYYRLWQSIAEKENNKTKALYFAGKVSFAIDSLYKRKLEISFEGLERKYKFQSQQVIIQGLNIKNQDTKLLLLLVTLCMSILGVLYLVRQLRINRKEAEYQTRLAKQRQELVEKEKENVEKEKQNNQLLERQLKFQSILLSNIKMHQTNTLKRPHVWKDGSKETMEKQYETFWNELKTYVDVEFNNFTTRLMDKHPTLSDSDVFFSCLLLSEFETGMIATILNVQAGSVIKQRYRLRTKLKLLNSENLLDYLTHF